MDEVFGRSNLRQVLTAYAQHYNEHRPHQAREQRPPLHKRGQAVDMTAPIKRTHVVQGLISEYRRGA
jgi:Integrase core domain